ncbi:carbohydrate ABC transporter permease [Nonomuraea fuscirosea]|jgi:putative aldouronate transport system permease protein|uniref:carbohydrate ABC transporter permease n=1 Tax=Nonomuraea fuscirosea TaxID=1291556 RepID=UPI002DDBDFCF|nr:carbohydrate ABC transporter permease [Nonomuraea fuscirosea]WSA53782.1 carbohydrate ABC transporter permease [Nonomuraea fuscirosea]
MTSSSRPVWIEPPNPVVTTIKAILIGLILLIMIYPLAYVILNSFASPEATTTAGLIPSEWSFSAYTTIFKGGIVQRSLIVSILITLVGTALSLAVTSTLAYALTKTRQIPGIRLALYLVLLTMIFSAGIIPNYLVVKSFGLLDSYWSLIVPVLASAFNVVVMRNFFMQLPRELFEAARMDGAGELSIFVKIVLPLSKAVMAVIGLFYAVSYWNSFFNAMLYLNDSSKWPIQLVLNSYVLQGSSMSSMNNTEMYNLPSSQAVQMAVVVMATVPILIVYPFLQKYFTKGVLTGAIKG